MKSRFDTLQEEVEIVLEGSERARNNDNFLIGTIYAAVYGVNVYDAMFNQEENNVPSAESITRCRRTAQRMRPELRATENTRRKRLRQKLEIENYVRGEKCDS